MLEIVVMMNHTIGSGIEGEMIAGDPREIVIGIVRGADVTGGDVTIAGRLSHEDCGGDHASPVPLLGCWSCSP